MQKRKGIDIKNRWLWSYEIWQIKSGLQ